MIALTEEMLLISSAERRNVQWSGAHPFTTAPGSASLCEADDGLLVKVNPAEAVAGRSGPSIAGVVATRGLKCRQGPCGVRDRASNALRLRRQGGFTFHEGRMCVTAMRGGAAPPGSRAGSCMEGRHRNMRGSIGALGQVTGGGGKRGAAGANTRAEIGSWTASYYR